MLIYEVSLLEALETFTAVKLIHFFNRSALVSDRQEHPYRQFLSTQTCYDLLPHTAKVIIIDSRLTVRSYA